MRPSIVLLVASALLLAPVAVAKDLDDLTSPDVPEAPAAPTAPQLPAAPAAPDAPERPSLKDGVPDVPDDEPDAPDAATLLGDTAWIDRAYEQAEEEYEATKEETDRTVRSIPEEFGRGLPAVFRSNNAVSGPDDAEEQPLGFAERFREAVDGPMMVAGLAGLGATLLGMVGFAAVTRYISPKEALKNPQRAMLYGFIRATPGAHLKQLSDEFMMKTSSILWHIRKLEAADLVHSERANGFRVFYPTEGGIDAKRLSRAITALHNGNAQSIQEAVNRRPGRSVKEIAEALTIHSGTVRWHLRKLREFGLLEELLSDDGSRFFPTPLGKDAIEAAFGKPTVATPTAGSRAGAAPVGGE